MRQGTHTLACLIARRTEVLEGLAPQLRCSTAGVDGSRGATELAGAGKVNWSCQAHHARILRPMTGKYTCDEMV